MRFDQHLTLKSSTALRYRIIRINITFKYQSSGSYDSQNFRELI